MIGFPNFVIKQFYDILILFQDRYAEGRFLPPIDPSQDWFLVNSEEEDDFTLLEFSRNFTTCDTRDLDIMVINYTLTEIQDYISESL